MFFVFVFRYLDVLLLKGNDYTGPEIESQHIANRLQMADGIDVSVGECVRIYVTRCTLSYAITMLLRYGASDLQQSLIG
jgi:hypothetical protein